MAKERKNEMAIKVELQTVKQVLEDTFSVNLYELETAYDYNSQSKWTHAYNRTNMSRDSLRADVLKVLK